VTAISERGGKEKTQHDNGKWFCPARDTGNRGALDSVLGDLDEGGRAAPRPNPEVVARAKRAGTPPSINRGYWRRRMLRKDRVRSVPCFDGTGFTRLIW
jgi:hypothetical protein